MSLESTNAVPNGNSLQESTESNIIANQSRDSLAQVRAEIRETELRLAELHLRESHLAEQSIPKFAGDSLEGKIILPIGSEGSTQIPAPELPSRKFNRFDELIRERSPHSAFSELNPQLVRHVEQELIFYVEALFKDRLLQHLQRLQLSGDDLARQAGFISEDEMGQKIIVQIARDMFTHYLQDSDKDDIIILPVNIIENRIDEGLSFNHGIVKSLYSPEDQEKLFYKTQVRATYRIVRDIILQQVREKHGIQEDAKTDMIALSENYTKEHTGMSHDVLVQNIAYRVINNLWQQYPEKHGAIQIGLIRHDSRDQMNMYIGRQDLFKMSPSSQVPLTIAPLEVEDLLDREFRQIFADCAREEVYVQFGARGHSIHAPLSSNDKEFIKDIELRIAGFNPDGTSRSVNQDFLLYRSVEERLTDWKKPLQREKSGFLAEDEREAVRRFQKEGGHAGLTSEEQFDFLVKHGLIIFIEKAIREDLRIVLGTFSFMSRTPCAPDEDAKPSGWHQEEEILRLFPQYNLRDLWFPPAFSRQTKQEIYDSAAKRLLICRSSVLPDLSQESIGNQIQNEILPPEFNNRALRRLGLAARLKFEGLNIGQHFGNDLLTFNIGQIDQPGSGIKMVNEPSSKHNSWAEVLTWHEYFTPLKGDELRMAWTAYQGTISQGIQEFIRPHGHLTGKGWDLQQMQQSVLANRKRVELLIKNGEHAEW